MSTDFSIPRPHGSHRLLARAVLEHELSELRLVLERHAGVLLDWPQEKLGSAIGDYLELRGLDSAEGLLSLLRASETECESLLEKLLDSETGFFRHPAAFEAFEKHILPELHARKSRSNPCGLRIWSVGCSTGEEIYSIAMTVCEQVNAGADGWKIQIVGSDIRRQALSAAERGLYTQQQVSGVPRSLVEAYFDRLGPHLRVKSRLRNLVTFTQMNLARAAYIGRFDCIFCMDVLPHFSSAQRAALVERLHLYLEPGGYLLLGQAEKLPNSNASFAAEPGMSGAFRKAMVAAARAGRA
jgi:chemotaxis methyl-accepting protein methylase